MNVNGLFYNENLLVITTVTNLKVVLAKGIYFLLESWEINHFGTKGKIPVLFTIEILVIPCQEYILHYQALFDSFFLHTF